LVGGGSIMKEARNEPPIDVLFFCGNCRTRWTAKHTKEPVSCPVCHTYRQIGIVKRFSRSRRTP
ncbi:MAG: hypothetical protein PHZ13_12195, partial [bacterium]|nr:hypothetical protein [bacterium]